MSSITNNNTSHNDDIDVDVDIDEDEIITLSSESEHNEEKEELKMEREENVTFDGKKSRKTVSFASLPSESNLYGNDDIQQSDLLDSLHLLTITLQQELDLMVKYFPGLQYQPYETRILPEQSSVQTIELKYSNMNETIPIHLTPDYEVQLILNILNTYPNQVCINNNNNVTIYIAA